MTKNSFYPVIKTIFFLAAVIGGIAFAFVLAFYSQYNSMIWIVCATVLFLIAILFLRQTRVSWIWSVLGGILVMVIYSILNFLVNFLLNAFIRGWLMD